MKKYIIISIIVMLIGCGFLSYPFVSNYLVQHSGEKAIQEMHTQLAGQEDGEIEAQRKLAREYNSTLTGTELKDPFVPDSGLARPDNYEEILDFANHVICSVEIPKIDVDLPVYHGVADDVLAKGVGHMSQTAFPIGGENNHTVLTGHSALSSARLFSDLTELKEGDTFYIHILNETLAYEVDRIKIVKPENTEDLLPVEGEDYVTLITCTPYAVNTHRLLVRGTRVPYTEQQRQEERQNGGLLFAGLDRQAVFYGAVSAGLLLSVICVVFLIFRNRRKRAA